MILFKGGMGIPMDKSIDEEFKKINKLREEHKIFMDEHGYPINDMIYKYFPWAKSKFIKKNIKKSQLYFASPNDFNDPFDTYPIIDMESVRAQGEAFIPNLFKYICPSIGADLLDDIKNSKIKLDDEFWDKYMFRLHTEDGVCCFTAKKDNLLMWAHYADYHKGICLGFEKNIKFKVNNNGVIFMPKKVTYSEERPKVDFFNITKTKEINPLTATLYTKSKEWEYEEEYRCVSLRYIGEVSYVPSNLKQIILGAKMPEKEKDEVRQFVKMLEYPPKLYVAKLKKNQYGLDISEDI